MKENKFRTKKIHITVSVELYERLVELKAFWNIDELVQEMLIEHFNIDRI